MTPSSPTVFVPTSSAASSVGDDVTAQCEAVAAPRCTGVVNATRMPNSLGHVTQDQAAENLAQMVGGISSPTVSVPADLLFKACAIGFTRMW